MARKRERVTEGTEQLSGVTVPERPASTDERDTIAKWAVMASLIVYQGESMVGAYRTIYKDPDAKVCPPAIAGNYRFRSMITQLRAAQGLTPEVVQGNIEALYMQTLLDESAPLKLKLQAAAQWQKLRGLEKIKEAQPLDNDELIWQQAMAGAKKVIDARADQE
jgi:hypothetical protein